MRAGKLQSTITIARRSGATTGDSGRKTDTWAPFLTTRAQIISSDAKTFLAEAGEQTETAIVFRCRYRDGVEPGDRVILGDRVFDLVEIKEVVPRRVTELRCTGGKS